MRHALSRKTLAAALALLGFAGAAQAQSQQDVGGTTIPRVAAVGAYVRPSFSFTPSTSAYSTGYSLGGVQSISGQPLGGIVANVSCQLSSGTFAGSIDLLLFSAQPGTYADNAAVTLSTADQALLQGVIHLTDVTSLGGAVTSVQGTNLGFVYALSGAGPTGTFYVLPTVRASVTFAASSTVACNFNTAR